MKNIEQICPERMRWSKVFSFSRTNANRTRCWWQGLLLVWQPSLGLQLVVSKMEMEIVCELPGEVDMKKEKVMHSLPAKFPSELLKTQRWSRCSVEGSEASI